MKPSAFSCIALDPPWNERGGGKIKRGADRHYPVLPVRDILRVILQSGSWRPDTNACHVWMWATQNHLADAHWLLDALSVRYVTGRVWVKVQEAPPLLISQPGFWVEPAKKLGLGQYFRHEHEHLLLGVIGRPSMPDPSDRVRSVLYAPRGRHSAKPEEAYADIERISPGPRVEFFARQPRAGWHVWGNEV